MSEKHLLPPQDQISGLLDLNFGAGVDEIVDDSLLAPLRDFLKRPGKKIRGQMVEIGFQFASQKDPSQWTSEQKKTIQQASELLEALHAASLIIDDIQDDSQERRGEPTVHRKHGVPLALNAGNWLYFWPLANVENWNVSSQIKLDVYRICHRGLLRAHFGQALDVGLNIFKTPQEKIKSTCLASLELKSGALMAMGLTLGAVVGGANETLESLCDRFGHAYGIALQMFDDSGNASIEGPKQFEDLKLKRPSWLVAVAAEALSNAEFMEFQKAVELLPQTDLLKKVLKNTQLVELARTQAKVYLAEALEILENNNEKLQHQPVQHIRELAELLVRAYV